MAARTLSPAAQQDKRNSIIYLSIARIRHLAGQLRNADAFVQLYDRASGNHEKKTWVGLPRLALETGKSPRTIRRRTAELRALGWIVKTRGPDGQKAFRITTPGLVPEPVYTSPAGRQAYPPAFQKTAKIGRRGGPIHIKEDPRKRRRPTPPSSGDGDSEAHKLAVAIQAMSLEPGQPAGPITGQHLGNAAKLLETKDVLSVCQRFVALRPHRRGAIMRLLSFPENLADELRPVVEKAEILASQAHRNREELARQAAVRDLERREIERERLASTGPSPAILAARAAMRRRLGLRVALTAAPTLGQAGGPPEVSSGMRASKCPIQGGDKLVATTTSPSSGGTTGHPPRSSRPPAGS